MRVSPIGWLCDNEDDVLKKAAESASVSHNHPEGIVGAQTVALAVFMARKGYKKQEIACRISSQFGYSLQRKLSDIRPKYQFDSSCQGSVPEAIISFLESTDFEDAIRNAVSLGGDTDTQAAVAGSIAEAFYGGVPSEIAIKARKFLDDDLNAVLDEFGRRVRG
jgi:ADP-ribosylglycohydrolase